MRIVACQFQKYLMSSVSSLDALKASLKGSNKTVILNENSELARILQGN